MKRITIFAVMCFLLLQATCKIVDFSSQAIYVPVEISRTFTIQTDDIAYDEIGEVDLSQEIEQAGVNPADIDTVYIQNVSLTVTRNETPPNTTTTGEVKFNGTSESAMLLASFEELELDLHENQVINPFNAIANFTLNPAGVAALRDKVFSTPPPVITVYLTGTVSQTPVDFDILVSITYQLQLELED